ncbi:MAG: hypothetical protein LUC27_08735 [Lachnospiraceae bacterium]|nr:hypothetical protein [Lachnospiraceae bacterium]
MKNFTEELTNRKVYGFLIPLFLSTILTQSYSVVSAAVTGRYLDAGALSVIVACSACLAMDNYICVSTTTGFGFYINRCVGSADQRRQREALWGALFICFVMIAVSLFLSRLAEPVMTLANVPDYMRENAKPYMTVILMVGGFWGLENLLIQVIEAFGESRVPALLSTAGVVLQTLVMIGLITWGGLDVEASALAILLLHLGKALILIVWMLLHSSGRELLLHPCLPSRPAWSELFKNGCSKSLMMIIIGLGAFVFSRRINTLPEDVLTGYSYGQTPVDLLMSSLSAYAVTAGLITGQNKEKNRLPVVRKWNRRLLVGSFLLSGVYILLVLAFAPALIRLLAGTELTAESLQAACLVLRIQVLALPLICCYMLCRNALQSLGVYWVLPLLGGTEAVINLLFAWFLIPAFGYIAVCWSAAAKWGIPALISLLLYFKKIQGENCKNDHS